MTETFDARSMSIGKGRFLGMESKLANGLEVLLLYISYFKRHGPKDGKLFDSLID